MMFARSSSGWSWETPHRKSARSVGCHGPSRSTRYRSGALMSWWNVRSVAVVSGTRSRRRMDYSFMKMNVSTISEISGKLIIKCSKMLRKIWQLYANLDILLHFLKSVAWEVSQNSDQISSNMSVKMANFAEKKFWKRNILKNDEKWQPYSFWKIGGLVFAAMLRSERSRSL